MTFGPVDVLCNNAGVFAGGLMWERPASDFTWTLGVNLWGILNGIRAFVPRMLAAGRPGHVVNTVSMAGLTTTAYRGPVHRLEVRGHGGDRVPCARSRRDRRADQGVGGRARLGRDADRDVGASPSAESGRDAVRGCGVRRASVGGHHRAGAAPEDVAAMIVDAIRSETFLVPTRGDYVEYLRQRCDSLSDRELPPMREFG